MRKRQSSYLSAWPPFRFFGALKVISQWEVPCSRFQFLHSIAFESQRSIEADCSSACISRFAAASSSGWAWEVARFFRVGTQRERVPELTMFRPLRDYFMNDDDGKIGLLLLFDQEKSRLSGSTNRNKIDAGSSCCPNQFLLTSYVFRLQRAPRFILIWAFYLFSQWLRWIHSLDWIWGDWTGERWWSWVVFISSVCFQRKFESAANEYVPRYSRIVAPIRGWNGRCWRSTKDTLLIFLSWSINTRTFVHNRRPIGGRWLLWSAGI